MSFFKALREVAHATESELEAAVIGLKDLATAETSAVTKEFATSIVNEGHFVSAGLETSYNGTRLAESTRVLRDGDIKEFGRLTNNTRLAEATPIETSAFRSSIISEEIPDIHIKDLEKSSTSVKEMAGGSLATATDPTQLSKSELERFNKSSEALEASRGGAKRELTGTFCKVAAGVVVGTVIAAAAGDRDGCYVSQTNGGKTTSCKIKGPLCPAENSPFYTTCPESVTSTLFSPFHTIKNASGELKNKIEKAAQEKIPSDDNLLELYIKFYQKKIAEVAPEVLTNPVINPDTGCAHAGCAGCDPTAPIYSPHFLGTTNSTFTITCVRGSTMVDTLMDLAGSAAASVVNPIINPSGAAAASSGTSGRISVILFVILIIVVVATIVFRRR